MLSSYISDPIILESALDREINAVNEEYQVYFQRNNVLFFQIICNMANKGNLLNRFIWGSMESLRQEKPELLLDDLKKFHQEHYTASRMCLVIKAVTADKMGQIKSWVQNYFSRLTDKKLPL